MSWETWQNQRTLKNGKFLGVRTDCFLGCVPKTGREMQDFKFSDFSFKWNTIIFPFSIFLNNKQTFITHLVALTQQMYDEPKIEVPKLSVEQCQ